MILETPNQINDIGSMIDAGNARIVGTVLHELIEYYVIDDLIDQATYHIQAALRPAWSANIQPQL